MSEPDDLRLLCERQTDEIRKLREQILQLTGDERKTDPTGLRPSILPEPPMPWEANITAKIDTVLAETRSNGRELAEIQRRLADGHEHMATTDEHQCQLEGRIEKLVSLVTTLAEERIADRKSIADFNEWKERWTRKHCEQCIADREVAKAL